MQYGESIQPMAQASELFGDSVIYRALKTDQFESGLLCLEPGKTAGYDGGHKNADELFYVVEGTAWVEYPATGKQVLVKQGELIVNDRDLPHVVSNPGTEPLKLLFVCCAEH